MQSELTRKRILCAIVAGVMLVIGVPLGLYAKDHWRVAYDSSDVPCLPYRLYALSLDPSSGELQRGDFVSYPAAGLEPWFDDGTVFTKLVAGVPGDSVLIYGGYVEIAGMPMGGISPKVAEKLQRDLDGFDTEYVLGPDQYFLVGTEGVPFDSRYYGPVDVERFIGEAYPLW